MWPWSTQIFNPFCDSLNFNFKCKNYFSLHDSYFTRSSDAWFLFVLYILQLRKLIFSVYSTATVSRRHSASLRMFLITMFCMTYNNWGCVIYYNLLFDGFVRAILKSNFLKNSSETIPPKFERFSSTVLHGLQWFPLRSTTLRSCRVLQFLCYRVFFFLTWHLPFTPPRLFKLSKINTRRIMESKKDAAFTFIVRRCVASRQGRSQFEWDYDFQFRLIGNTVHLLIFSILS